MADLRLKVSTEEVRNKASQITTKRTELEGLMSDMRSKVVALEEYWKSQSGTNYSEQYTAVTKNIQASLDALQKHTNNLVEAAASYEQMDSQQTQKTSSLSTQNIF